MDFTPTGEEAGKYFLRRCEGGDASHGTFCPSVPGRALGTPSPHACYWGQSLQLDVVFWVSSSPLFRPPPAHTHTHVHIGSSSGFALDSVGTCNRTVLLWVKRQPIGSCGVAYVTCSVTSALSPEATCLRPPPVRCVKATVPGQGQRCHRQGRCPHRDWNLWEPGLPLDLALHPRRDGSL